MLGMSTREELEKLLLEDGAAVRERESKAFGDLLKQAGGRVVLFGAGSMGRTALRNLRAAGIYPLAFVDNNEQAWGTERDGLAILSPPEAATKYGDSALFVVTIWSLHHMFRTTRRQLEHLGVRHVVSSSPLRWQFPDGLLPYFCQDFPHKVYAAKERVLAAESIWSDAYSRSEYLNQVKWRALGDYDALNFPVEEESYFPASLFALRPDEYFVDCGAYTGDTGQRLLELTGNKLGRLLEIEPDPANRKALQAWISGLPHEIADKISILDIAVGASRGQVSFNADGTEGAAISSSGSMIVEMHRLDDLLASEHPTYIKMDIEGAELDAIEGGRAVIERCKPVLAICLYHRQSDLWEIPLKVQSIVKDYRFYLRPHDVDGWQTVMYAVPPERSLAK